MFLTKTLKPMCELSNISLPSSFKWVEKQTHDKITKYFIEGVDNFKYLLQMLDRSEDEWPAVRRNVGKARRLWSRLGKLIKREGKDPRVSGMFYREVVQAVLLFGA